MALPKQIPMCLGVLLGRWSREGLSKLLAPPTWPNEPTRSHSTRPTPVTHFVSASATALHGGPLTHTCEWHALALERVGPAVSEHRQATPTNPPPQQPSQAATHSVKSWAPHRATTRRLPQAAQCNLGGSGRGWIGRPSALAQRPSDAARGPRP